MYHSTEISRRALYMTPSSVRFISCTYSVRFLQYRRRLTLRSCALSSTRLRRGFATRIETSWSQGQCSEEIPTSPGVPYTRGLNTAQDPGYPWVIAPLRSAWKVTRAYIEGAVFRSGNAGSQEISLTSSTTTV